MAGAASLARATALDDYVTSPDANYSYSLANTFSGPGHSVNVWAMTSQAWRNPSEVDRTLWQHWLIVIVPDSPLHTKSLLWIGAGDNGGAPPASADPLLVQIATLTRSIVAEIRMIPNQPLKFAGETDPRYVATGRREDELIAFAWDKFRSTGDPTWLPRLPMTKAVVRAMDTVQALHPGITAFMVAGASKRGWTTWTTAATDLRVEAIAPLVIDILNVEHSMRHHWDAYGYWAAAIHDYVDMGIPGWLHTPEFRSLLAIVDPYCYVDRLTMPKFIINSTGDQFFLPDSSQFYFDALKGEKHLRYVPNTDHGLNGEAFVNLTAYYEAYLNNTPRPQFDWTKRPDGSLRVQTITPPAAVRLWQATNPTQRNFRLDTIGPSWSSAVLADQGGGLYIGALAPPAHGWNAFFVELEFSSGGTYPFKFTTEVSVVPDTLPFRQPGGWGTTQTVGQASDQICLVKVGGDRYQMGYWYGRLLADQIAAVWSALSVAVPFTDTQYAGAIDAIWKSAHFDTVAWEAELRGVADGCADAGHHEITFREMQKMLIFPDMSEYGCGLYAVWGRATARGDLFQLRNLDWSMNTGVQDYPVVAIYDPVDGNRHATIGFAGVLGVPVGGINEHGLAVSEIMGYFGDPETLQGIPFPVLLRDVLYHHSTLAEALSRIRGARRTNQYYYCVADPAAAPPKARLLLTSNLRCLEYGDESVVGHPGVTPDPFHASLDDVVYWKGHDGSGNQNLYNAISLRYGSIDSIKALEIARADGVGSTLVSIVYHNSACEFWVAYADGSTPAQLRNYVHFRLDETPASAGAHYWMLYR